MEDTSFLALIGNASFVVKLVMFILAGLSVAGWSIVLLKYMQFRRLHKAHLVFSQAFNLSSDLDKLSSQFSALKDKAFMIDVFLTGYKALREHSEQSQEKKEVIETVERHIYPVFVDHLGRLQRYISLLATIGSVSPYIGLFGTVWGIMNSFIGLSGVEQTTIAAVAPGIAEALVATAIGLFAAIPALVAYNFFTEKINQISNSLEQFTQNFINLIDVS